MSIVLLSVLNEQARKIWRRLSYNIYVRARLRMKLYIGSTGTAVSLVISTSSNRRVGGHVAKYNDFHRQGCSHMKRGAPASRISRPTSTLGNNEGSRSTVTAHAPTGAYREGNPRAIIDLV